MTRLEAINEQIDEIMDTFDFDKVKKTMDFFQWEWSSSNGVPEDYEIRKSARKLMKNLIDFENGGVTACGGFRTILTQAEDNCGKWLRVDLSFCIDDTLLDGKYYE